MLICSGKVAGAEALLARTKAAPLVTINLFSSLAAFSGSGGQGAYAAANGVLDSHALELQVTTEQGTLATLGAYVEASSQPSL